MKVTRRRCSFIDNRHGYGLRLDTSLSPAFNGVLLHSRNRASGRSLGVEMSSWDELIKTSLVALTSVCGARVVARQSVIRSYLRHYQLRLASRKSILGVVG